MLKLLLLLLLCFGLFLLHKQSLLLKKLVRSSLLVLHVLAFPFLAPLFVQLTAEYSASLELLWGQGSVPLYTAAWPPGTWVAVCLFVLSFLGVL
ncbi:hypothetical protein GE09DRAFT_1139398 [Coniochaeta sp. 2T2.1]|nr:hypothetical protein GE09DRAFT_1139398 [Coniochaeta sp. 2T2.1]